jgi:hypothetical protein
MTGGSRFAWLVGFAIGGVCMAAVLVFLQMWAATVERMWGRPIATQPSNTGHSFAEVWHRWHPEGAAFGEAELSALLVLLILPVAAGFAAWLLLPDVHRGDSVWKSYRRAFQGVASGVGLLAFLTAAAGSLLVTAVNAEKRGAFNGDFYFPLTMLVMLGSACLLVSWLSLAVGSLAAPMPGVDIPLRCEGCGYDLTHQSANGRCSECGLELASSLTSGARRPGCVWEAKSDFANWLRTSFYIVISPQRFYERLKLRTPPGPSQAFARRQLLVIGLCAAMWMFLMVFEESSVRGRSSMFYVPLLVALAASLMGWGLHRFVSAIATSWWMVNRAVPDMAWARKVIAYETSYLWVFCLYNGVWMTSLMMYDTWLTDVLAATVRGRIHFLGLPPEAAAILFGNIALILAWLWRYHIAGRAIRWSNY